MTQFVGLAPGQAPKGHLAGLPPCPAADRIERVVLAIGQLFAFCWLLLVLLIILSVAERYAPPITATMALVFGATPGTALGELQWWLFAAGFMTGLPYAMVRGSHVRIDVVAEHWSLRRKAWVELLGTALFLLPFCALLLFYGMPFVLRSIQLNEISASPGGLGAFWLAKSLIVVAPALLVLVGVARLLRVGNYLFNRAPN